VERITQVVSHGIEDYVFVFHSGLSKKRTLERWRSALKERHAILVIGTPQYLTLERYFTTIILDEEHARGWKSLVRPLIDMRVFIESYARATGSTLILGAPILRAETQKRITDGLIEEFERIAVHTQKNIRTSLIDPRLEEKNIKEKTGKRAMQILTDEVRTLIENAREKNQNVVLISARKGLAPITVCDDCGTVVRCKVCDNPLVIHHIKRSATTPLTDKKSGLRIFTCHTCGFVRAPEDDEHETCKQCGGWRLGALGIGTERIQEEVEKLFPDTPHVIFDGEHITTRAQAKKCIARFEENFHSILIGTPMVIPYLSTADHIVIVSLDSLFAIPDFRINEHIFALVLTLREKARSSLLIQTRADDTTLFTQAITGDLLTFSENELALRKTFLYPPYSTIVKIILRGTKEEFPQKIATLKTFLSSYEIIAPNTITKDSKNTYRTHVILKLKTWPDENLITKLRALPPEFTVDVNPDHLL
jgi:primosomal protein N' (replication factor Y)